MIGLATWMVWSVLPQFQLLSHTEISDGGGHCKLNIHVNIGFVCYSKYPRCFVLLWGFLFFQWRYVKIKMIWLVPIDWYHMFRRVENPKQQIDTVIIYLAILFRGVEYHHKNDKDFLTIDSVYLWTTFTWRLTFRFTNRVSGRFLTCYRLQGFFFLWRFEGFESYSRPPWSDYFAKAGTF